jgi:hypothetical protein
MRATGAQCVYRVTEAGHARKARPLSDLRRSSHRIFVVLEGEPSLATPVDSTLHVLLLRDTFGTFPLERAEGTN